MRILFTVFLFFPLISFCQSTDQQLITAETELAILKRKEDSLLSKIEEFRLQKLLYDLTINGLPAVSVGEQPVFHTAYALSYSEEHEQAKWVAHIIVPDIRNGNEGRTNNFSPDTSIHSGSAVEADYFVRVPNTDSTFKYVGFGYDRGHLAPSADFRYSKKALSESYLYSNMAPQVAELNRQRWAEMEDLLRQYVLRNNEQIYIVTGGVLKPGLKKIDRGINKVSIPEYYYKVALDIKNNRGIGFLMPNRACEYPVMSYACSIDSIEYLSGLDFFPALPDEQENSIERFTDMAKWVNDKEQEDVVPLRAQDLPRNTFNSVQAQYYVGKNEAVQICGTVVSTKLSSKGNIFLNLDKKFPNQVFSISIFKDNITNFSYNLTTFLAGKSICVTGKITSFNGTPTMNIINEKAIIVQGEQFLPVEDQ